MNIKLETAKLAKEKGFNIPVHYHYTETPVNDLELLVHPDDPQLGQGWKLVNYNDKVFVYPKYSAPYQFELQKWLRDVHNIYVDVNSIVMLRDSKRLFGGHVNGNFRPLSRHIIACSHSTYEEALEQTLIEALKTIY
jgi:hypothetical protein